ncbi:MAG TPA: thiamine pyrophosphate-dependent enzyme [Stellaceae bacterium]|nr:thiamine pyrophosphate-dependent enzyme [Stellaceae bacterium]
MMRRDLAFRILARHVRDEIVVPVYQGAQEWRALRPDHALTYYSIGAMGQASSAALGLALGRPDKRVIVLDGDGSLLMNLGTLVTIASQAPANLVHFVCQNGMYEANGAHPIPGRDRLNFAALAKAAGYPKTYEFSDLGEFEAKVAGVLGVAGPVFATLKLVPGEPPPQDYTFIHGAGARETFKAALKRG